MRAALPFTNRSVMYRLKYIVAELRKGSRTACELAMGLEVSDKTINRDIELLRNLGVNISSNCDFEEGNFSFGYQLYPGINVCPFCSCKTIQRNPDFHSRTSPIEPVARVEHKAYIRSFLTPTLKVAK